MKVLDKGIIKQIQVNVKRSRKKPKAYQGQIPNSDNQPIEHHTEGTEVGFTLNAAEGFIPSVHYHVHCEGLCILM